MRKPETTDTVIAAGTTIEGNLRSSNSLWINGDVTGSIEGKANVTVAEQAQVKADINADTVFIAGRVAGSVNADTLSLQETAILMGDVTAKHLVVAEGAILQGKVSMPREDAKIKNK